MFISPDSLVPDVGNPSDLNRYAYARSNPLKYRDPSGHFPITPIPFPDQWLPQVGEWISEGWMRLQPLIYQLAVDLGQLAEGGPAIANGVAPTIQSASDAGARLGQALQNSQGAGTSGAAGDPGQFDPNKLGRWVQRTESMSERARAYQEYVTGNRSDHVFQIDGVSFDGVRDGVLVDAKGYYQQFVDPASGGFKTWWSGADKVVQQAQRQIEVAKGVPIEWHFNEAGALEAVRKLFAENGLGGNITLVLDQMP